MHETSNNASKLGLELLVLGFSGTLGEASILVHWCAAGFAVAHVHCFEELLNSLRLVDLDRLGFAIDLDLLRKAGLDCAARDRPFCCSCKLDCLHFRLWSGNDEIIDKDANVHIICWCFAFLLEVSRVDGRLGEALTFNERCRFFLPAHWSLAPAIEHVVPLLTCSWSSSLWRVVHMERFRRLMVKKGIGDVQNVDCVTMVYSIHDNHAARHVTEHFSSNVAESAAVLVGAIIAPASLQFVRLYSVLPHAAANMLTISQHLVDLDFFELRPEGVDFFFFSGRPERGMRVALGVCSPVITRANNCRQLHVKTVLPF